MSNLYHYIKENGVDLGKQIILDGTRWKDKKIEKKDMVKGMEFKK